jgi:hypothetical protein
LKFIFPSFGTAVLPIIFKAYKSKFLSPQYAKSVLFKVELILMVMEVPLCGKFSEILS